MSRTAVPLLAAALTAILVGCAPEAAPITALSTEAERSIAEEALLNTERGGDPAQAGSPIIEDLALPGPAAGLGVDPAGSAASINRIGSAEVPVRRYDPAGEPWGTLVWAHGGSFVRGNLDWPESDWVSRRFAEAGLRVYAVDYALASERVKAPASANDVTAVLRRVLDDEQGPVAIGGASAGGHLAAEAALTVAECAAGAAEAGGDAATAPLPQALLLEYPTLHRVQRADPGIASLTAGLEAQRRFGPDRISEMYGFYLGDEQPVAAADVCGSGYRTSPRVVGETPASSLSLLPPTIIVNAEADDLRASAEQFAEQLSAAGVPVSSSVQPGTIHGYMNRPEVDAASLAAAQQTIDTFVAELREVLGAVEAP